MMASEPIRVISIDELFALVKVPAIGIANG
jgi:hypothetical protein